MKINAITVEHGTTEAIIADMSNQLQSLGYTPSLVIGYFNTEHSVNALRETLVNLVDCPFMLTSSCSGALGSDGDKYASKNDLVLFCLEDSEGHYGVGVASIGKSDPQQAAQQALLNALENSGLEYESPALIWCALPPGEEEAILAGFADIAGSKIPVFGGSGADNDISGNWQFASREQSGSDLVMVSVLHTSKPLGMSYSSGYKPSDKTCKVTEAHGRELTSINGQSAADYYDALTGGSISAKLEGDDRSVLAETTLSPLGHEVSISHGVPEYLLSHPSDVTEQGGLSLFTEVSADTEFTLMEGSVESLAVRAEKVVANAIELLPISSEPVGVLMIYCAGCMLAIGDEVDTMLGHVRKGIDGIPVVAAYTFGEQGQFLDKQNRHGNLMISAVVFGS
ncbi:MAG: hypothetical protein GJ680_03860 [Alteromonadaceae bacterium]|nr:hypothetical protein [Alteromonadaceae bacterium]